VMPSITKTGVTRTAPTQWQITQIVVLPGNSVPNAAGGTSVIGITPCGTYFKALPNADCSTVKSGNTTFNSNGTWQSGTVLAAAAITVADYDVGTKICYALSVQPHTSSNTDWLHSAPICLIVGKKPKVQIWAGDAISGGLIQTSTSVKNIGGKQMTFGSWGEYALFANSSIAGMGSGSAFAGSGMQNATICGYSTLSFTNAGNSVCTPVTPIGGYVVVRNQPDVAGSFTVNASDPTRDLGNNIDLSSGNLQGIYTTSGAVSLTGGGAGKSINKGQWIVINAPTATINIDGDINYTNGVLKSLSDIPQVVIIAKNINIDDSVQNVDAWLVASGSINTCSAVGVVAPLDSNMCNKKLTVNGPVITNKLYLRRTAGSGVGAASGDPAEVFNLRADVYLWSEARAMSNGHVQTVYVTELPPRF